MIQMVDKAGSATEVSAQPSAPDDAMLVIIRDFAAPIGVVWSALTDLDQAPAWWGPRGFRTPRETIEADFEVGGMYRACMISEATGEKLWWSGIPTEIDPPHRFVFTHAWDNADGTRGFETEVTFELEETGPSSTRMTFTQGPFDTNENRDGHGTGWGESLDRLAEHIGGG
jgi:uncharacterized protein YndB with AHSA1/START domain